jgi:RpiR family transcriptional regulator, carbohydrate utilization regulator
MRTNEVGCLYQIHDTLSSLSAKERIVADYILAAPGESVNPSIEELSERIGVSESTLFRFVRKLGYDGYQQFRIALATESAESRRTVYEAEIDVVDERSAMAVVFSNNIAALERTMAMLDPADLARAAELLIAARNILFFGLGGSAVVAQDAYHKLVRTGLSCGAPNDFHMQLMAASQLGSEDVAVIMSHTGANKDALAVADEVKKAGARLIVMTDYNRSPIVKLADHTLISYTCSSRYASESFSARIVQLALIDALYVSIMERLGEEGRTRLERMRSAIARRRT